MRPNRMAAFGSNIEMEMADAVHAKVGTSQRRNEGQDRNLGPTVPTDALVL